MLHVGDNYPRARHINGLVTALDEALRVLSAKKGCEIVDISYFAAPKGLLLPQYSQPDGCHLRAPAYAAWRDEVHRILRKEGL